ncbi:MAG: tetratricopeptide repeat protein [Deltaproteobacteria bacterium]|nr:tetratricopeptide repeat protein [Deltaproteobacteria bacterium]
MIFLAEYLLIDRTWEAWKRKIPWFVAAFTLWAVFVLYISGFFSGGIEGRGLLEDVSDLMQETEYVSRWSYLCTQFNVLVIYIRLLFLPIGQNLDYVYRFNNTFFDGHTPLAFAFLVGVIAIGIWNIRKRPVISFGIFWFFITLSVESSIIPIQDAIFEHRLYLPMFGFALTISYLVFHFLSRRLSWAIVVSAIIIMCLGTATYLRNMKWKDGITLWTDVLSESPQNTRAKNNLANLLVTEGRHREAIKYYSDVLWVEPAYMDAHVNLANVLAIQGNFDAAIQHYTAALEINPRSEKAHYNLGNALVDQGKEKAAVRHFLYALSIRLDFAEAHCKLGNVLVKLGNLNRAVGHFLEALRLKPYYAEAYNSLGIALIYQGKIDEAILRFREALSINPNDVLVQRNLTQALKEKAQFRKEKVLPEVQNKVNSDGMLRR